MVGNGKYPSMYRSRTPVVPVAPASSSSSVYPRKHAIVNGTSAAAGLGSTGSDERSLVAPVM